MPALIPALALLLAAAPEVVVVRRTTVGVAEPTVLVVMRAITEGLKKEGLGAREAPHTCTGDRGCLATTARTQKVAAALGVTLIRSRRDLTVDLEAVDGSERPLVLQTFSVPLSGEPFPEAGAAFFASLSAAMTARRLEDAPRVVRLEPEQGGEAAPLVLRSERSNTLGRFAAVTSIAAGAAAIGLLIAGGVMKGSFEARVQPGRVAGSRAEAQGQANAVNAMFTGSLVSTVVALAAGTSAVVFWETGASAEE